MKKRNELREYTMWSSDKLNPELVEKAYKKLKSSVYYDKTLLALRNKVVQFEMDHGSEIDARLRTDIFNPLLSDKDADFDNLVQRICEGIKYIALPKKLESEKGDIIINTRAKKIKIEELQYYIDMPVYGHILGVLWIMMVGYHLDKKLYEHSYGNRVRKNLINEFRKDVTYSPNLFEPYFEQYESWRDKAMDEAQRHMKLRQDVVIMTLDFKRYYYSLDVDEDIMKQISDEAFEAYKEETHYDEKPAEEVELYKRISKKLTAFIGRVIEAYSKLFRDFDGRRILPIGFLPSNIIGNWYLNLFDRAITEGWNPLYYGRYVDDILIVDKVERNSQLYSLANEGKLSRDTVIRMYLQNCSKWHGDSEFCVKNDKNGLLEYDKRLTCLAKEDASKKGKDSSNITVYKVRPRFLPNQETAEVIVHNDKMKVFYFKWDESDALITCFRETIAQNVSEFRHLPEDEVVFQKDDYSEIYELEKTDTVNKFRGIEGIHLDKYKLSKFLGKYLRVGAMINGAFESRFEKDIERIFDSRTLLENYAVWEKVIEILVIDERFDAVKAFCERIKQALDSIDIDDSHKDCGIVEALQEHEIACLCRSLALVWKRQKREKLLHGIWEKCFKNKSGTEWEEYIFDMIRGYYNSRMIDKSVVPFLPHLIDITMLDNDEANINLTNFSDAIKVVGMNGFDLLRFGTDEASYKYFPYLIGMHELNIVTCVREMHECSGKGSGKTKEKKDTKNTKTPFEDYERINLNTIGVYLMTNYQKELNEKSLKKNFGKEAYRRGESNEGSVLQILDFSEKKTRNSTTDNTSNTLYVGVLQNEKSNKMSNAESKLRIAIANVREYGDVIESVVTGKQNRSYDRYRDLASIVNTAVDQKADLLVMPEAYVPFEWLSTLARTCERNQLAVVTGVEHVLVGDGVYNFTAVILPYLEENRRCASITFHLKRHYAPEEILKINGYLLRPISGKNYELYHWKGTYFPVYCCFELASIVDRSLFQSYADMIVAVEWNHDVNYYGSIVDSLSRDIHCYCVQVNYSPYGDSRITRPSKTEKKDVIRTKGGLNCSVLIEDIDIAGMRSFQLPDYSVQQGNEDYKMTPPNFDHDLVLRKIKGEPLFDI